MTTRIAALAEALFVVRISTNVPHLDRKALWAWQGASVREVFTNEAAAILAALPPDWCGHESAENMADAYHEALALRDSTIATLRAALEEGA